MNGGQLIGLVAGRLNVRNKGDSGVYLRFGLSHNGTKPVRIGLYVTRSRFPLA